MKTCPKCGKTTDSRFCPDCGFDLAEVTELTQDEEIDEITVGTETEANTDAVQEAIPAENPQDAAENTDSVNEAVEENAIVAQPSGEEEKKSKKKKTKFIVGGIIAAVLLIAIAVIAQPKLVSIDASYNGPTEKGTVVDENSDITVTGTYEDKSTKDITGWSVDKTVITPGYNTINVTYEDKSTSVSVYSPLMSGGQYVASVDEIKDVLYSYNTQYVDGFSGFSKDAEIDGKYNYEGSVLDLSVSFTKKSGSENEDVDGSEIPNAMIVTMTLKSDNFSTDLDRILSAGAAAFTAVDPEIKYDDAYTQIKTCTSDAVNKASGAMASDVKSLDNLDIGTGMILANGNLLIFYSFKSK